MIKLKHLINIRKPLNEDMTFNDLLKFADQGRIDRAAHVKTRSVPVTMEDGQESWNFRYKSNPSVTDEPFQGSITFAKEVGNDSNAADLPCKVDCSCPDFKYRFAYNDTAKNASQTGQDSLNKCNGARPQPAYDYGEGLCKHLIALGSYLKTKITATRKSNLFEAMNDVAQTNRNFNVEY